MPDLISQSELARRLGIDRREVYDLRKEGAFHLVQKKVDYERACEQLGQYWDARGELITQSAYAKRHGVVPSYITKLKQKGIIPIFAGKVHPEIADVLWAKSRDPAMPMQRKGTPDPDVLITPRENSHPGHSETDEEGLTDPERYHRARADLTEQQARKARIEAAEKEGDVISRDEVYRQAFHTYRELQNSLMGIPDRTAVQLAGMESPKEIVLLLRSEIEESLTGIAKDLEKYSEEEE